MALFEDEWYSDSDESGMSSYDEDEESLAELEDKMREVPISGPSDESDSACYSRKSSSDGTSDAGNKEDW